MILSYRKWIFGFALSLCYMACAYADVEVISIIPTKFVGVYEKAAEVYKNSMAELEEASSTALKAKEGADKAEGVAKKATDPEQIAAQAQKTLTTEVMQGIGTIDETTPQSELADTVTDNYAHTYNQSEQEIQKKEIMLRYQTGRNLGRLFLRAINLRLAIQDESFSEEDIKNNGETSEDGTFEPIDKAREAIIALSIKSAERWNKILEMQSYMNEYRGALEMRNVTADKEDEDE